MQVEIVQGDWGVVWDKQKHLETAANVFPYRTWPDYATIQPSSDFETQKDVSFNLGYYSNPQVDAWIDEGTKEEAVDKKKSAEAWQKACKEFEGLAGKHKLLQSMEPRYTWEDGELEIIETNQLRVSDHG